MTDEAGSRLVRKICYRIPILLLAFAVMAQTVPFAHADDNRKVILTYQGREKVHDEEVDLFTVGKDRSIILGLIPLDREPPLSPGDIQVCAEFTQAIGIKTVDGKEYGNLSEIAFICSGRRYLFNYLTIR